MGELMVAVAGAVEMKLSRSPVTVCPCTGNVVDTSVIISSLYFFRQRPVMGKEGRVDQHAPPQADSQPLI
jgi:hypothetical protein